MENKKEKNLMWKIAILELLVASLAFAQTPGTVTNTSKITAIAGNLTCEGVILPSKKGISFTCKVDSGVAIFSGQLEPVVGPTSGLVASAQVGANNITVQVNQATETSLTHWQVTANGTLGQGDF